MPEINRILIAMLMLAVLAFSGIFSQAKGASTEMADKDAVILLNGDTLYGKVNLGNEYVEKYPTEVRFTSNSGTSTIFKASELSEAIIYPVYFNSPEPTTPDVYVSLPSVKNGTPVFYKQLLKGKVRVFRNNNSTPILHETKETDYEYEGVAYHYSKKEGLTGEAQINETTRVVKSYTTYSSYYVSKNNAPFVKVENSNCDVLYPQLFGDCPALDREVEKNNGLLKFKNFMIFAEAYNQLCN
jgi:hypothetical protein